MLETLIEISIEATNKALLEAEKNVAHHTTRSRYTRDARIDLDQARAKRSRLRKALNNLLVVYGETEGGY